MNFVDREFSKVEQISSKYSISENQVIKRINKSGNYMIKKFENKSMLIFFYQNCSYFINCFIVSNQFLNNILKVPEYKELLTINFIWVF